MIKAWEWLKSVGAFVVDVIDEWPTATAIAWPASLVAVWWFL